MMVYSKLLPRSIYQISRVVTFIEEFHLYKTTILHQIGNGAKINNPPPATIPGYTVDLCVIELADYLPQSLLVPSAPQMFPGFLIGSSNLPL